MKIIIIGTLHLGLTRKNDLLKILEEIKPDQLLVELPEEESARARAGLHSDEMEFAATWADTKGIQVNYFDPNLSSFREGVASDDSEYKQLEAEEIEEIRGYSWQELNKKEPWMEGKLASIDRQLWKKYLDPQKEELREKKMLENIQKLKKSIGTILILTGIGHLNFFEKELPEAELIFRK